MYSFQFQHTGNSNEQYDIVTMNNENNSSNNNNNNNNNAFPSPITSASLDSPPNKNNHSNSNFISLTKSFNSRLQPQYDMASYMSTPSNFNSSNSNNNNNNIRSPTSPNNHQQQQQHYSMDNISDTASSNLISPTSPNSLEDEIMQRNMQQMFEKKRRRRESHNAVERRRRDNINERINELATLLPDRDAIKTSKGIILRKSVDHIRLLHDKLRQHQQRIQELESMLEVYRVRMNQPHQQMIPPGHPLDLSGIQPHLNHANYRRDG